MKLLSTISTVINLAHHANKGMFLHDKKLSFLVAGLGVIGLHRKNVRHWFRKQIDASDSNNLISLNIRVNQIPLHLVMRHGNEGDYLMTGELVRGGYNYPDFEPKLIIDGGANIGMFAVQATTRFPKARVICYEPDSLNFQILNNNINLNKLQVETHPLGLWSEDCVLYYHPKTSETGYVDKIPSGIPIECKLPVIEEDTWLKLDVEGAEYEILPALFDSKLFPRWISMEIHDFNERGQEILQILKSHNYNIIGGDDLSVGCAVISAIRR
jgi:FkbM family methyltransferase